jgi:quinone-modifying oxidoreductase subunit QmoC
MLLLAAALLALALLARDSLNAMVQVEAHHALYADFFPHWQLIAFFTTFTGLAFLFGGVVGAARFWRAMKAADEASGAARPKVGMLTSILRVLKSILVHDRFGKCTSQAPRRLAHLATFYGFAALFVVTTWAVIDIYVMPLVGVAALYPFDLMHPMKVLANGGCVLLIFGCIKAIADRMAGRHEDRPGSTSFDWVFLWLLLGVALTGLATEVLRFSVGPEVASASTALKNAALSAYFVHLVLVFQLLVHLPYSKFAHIVYRTVAMVYAEHTGRSGRETARAGPDEA